MRRLTFFKGLLIGLFISFILWTGIIYAVIQFMPQPTNPIATENVASLQFKLVD